MLFIKEKTEEMKKYKRKFNMEELLSEIAKEWKNMSIREKEKYYLESASRLETAESEDEHTSNNIKHVKRNSSIIYNKENNTRAKHTI